MIGIYCLTNKVNGKKYIGQSWDIDKRYKEHRTRHKNDHMGNAINKYGFDSFELSVLRSFGNHGLTQSLLDIFERKYILAYNTTNKSIGYNKTTGGGSASIVNDEIKEKISKSNTGKKKPLDSIPKYSRATLKYYAIHGSPCKGKAKKEETKQKISNSLKGRAWSDKRRSACIITEETREKLSAAHTGVKWSQARWSAYYKRYPKDCSI